jgi:hypothetical protein
MNGKTKREKNIASKPPCMLKTRLGGSHTPSAQKKGQRNITSSNLSYSASQKMIFNSSIKTNHPPPVHHRQNGANAASIPAIALSLILKYDVSRTASRRSAETAEETS